MKLTVDLGFNWNTSAREMGDGALEDAERHSGFR